MLMIYLMTCFITNIDKDYIFHKNKICRGHWVLVLIDPIKDIIYYLGSMLGKHVEELIDMLSM